MLPPKKEPKQPTGQHVPDGIVPADAVPVSTASNLMVPEGISDTMTLRARKFIVVEKNAQPIGEAAAKFTILQVKAGAPHSANHKHEGGRWTRPMRENGLRALRRAGVLEWHRQ